MCNWNIYYYEERWRIPLVVYDFTGKTILPLCTNEGSGMGSSENDINMGQPLRAALLIYQTKRFRDIMSASQLPIT